MVKPTIHLNGSGKYNLQKGYRIAYKAIREAQEAIDCIEFNPRDYYVQGPTAWIQASKEMTERIQSLAKIREDLSEILESME